MKRRVVLTAGIATTIGLAGCLDTFRSDGSSSDESSTTEGPESVAETFVSAVADGDAEAVDDLRHEDGKVDVVDDATFDRAEDVDLEVEELAVIDEADETAVVEFELVVSSDGEAERSSDGKLALRTDDDEWKVWEVSLDGDGGSKPPLAAVDVDSDRVAVTNADHVDEIAMADDADCDLSEPLLDPEVGDSIEHDCESGDHFRLIGKTDAGSESTVLAGELP